MAGIPNELNVKIVKDLVCCNECLYFRPYKDAPGYGSCISRHTFDGAFRECDYCSYAKRKDAK